MATWQAMMWLEVVVADGGEGVTDEVGALAGEVQCEAMNCYQASETIRPKGWSNFAGLLKARKSMRLHVPRASSLDSPKPAGLRATHRFLTRPMRLNSSSSSRSLTPGGRPPERSILVMLRIYVPKCSWEAIQQQGAPT